MGKENDILYLENFLNSFKIRREIIKIDGEILTGGETGNIINQTI